MNNTTKKFMELTPCDKLRVVLATALTVILMASLPAYAWFTTQKKAAEMYEVEAPSTLILSAAHREVGVDVT